MFALIPKEMLETGNWLTPTLNGAPYLDKPPLIYWLNILAYKILGVSEGAARIPNFLGVLGEIWFTYLIGLHLLNRRAAWLGGFILLTSIGFFSLHLIIYTDHLISLTLAASLYFFLRWQERPDFRWVALFYLSLAVGFLSKGLIGVVFPILISGLYALSLRQWGHLVLFLSWRGWALVALVAAPWLAAMEITHPGFLEHHIVNEQIQRFFGQRYPLDINSFSIPGFWLFLGMWLLPWTLLLPEAIYRFWRQVAAPSGTNPQGRFLLIWAAVIMGFFTLSASRNEYYSLPALPPLALVLGWRVQRFLATSRDHSLTLALVLLALFGLATPYVLPHLEEFLAANRREFIGLFELVGPHARQVMVVVPLLTALGGVAGWRYPSLGLAAYGMLALALLYFTFQACLALSPLMSDKIPGEYIRRHAGPGDLVIMEYMEEFEYGASLAFYADRHILMVKRGNLPQFPYPVAPEQNYLIPPEKLKKLWLGTTRVFLLADEVLKLEPYLEEAPVKVAFTGKSLLLNQAPLLADKQ
jgi:4-amino-4-deoxy-L-arabinose transferase-like glycosyltransferase